MLVYGDMERREDAQAVRAAMAELLAAAQAAQAGLERHSLLVEAFVGASEAVGAIVDAGWEERGFDAPSAREQAGLALVYALAELVGHSWENAFALPEGGIQAAAGLVAAAIEGTGTLQLRQAEGFAVYALYPETFWEAATGSGLDASTQVVGIRGIGLALGSLVAAALRARPPVTLRPTGHPFARRVEAGPGLRNAIAAAAVAANAFAIVDEGPGLSGSSFGAVSQFLRGAGVAAKAIRFFPSHGNGPGLQASAETRSSWAASPQVWRSFEDAILASPHPHRRLERWVAELVGPLEAPLEDIGAGGWRQHVAGGGGLPALPHRERRKFLARTGNGTFLVKFAGLGTAGRRKLDAARRLHAAGFGTEPLGLCHGMLVERWLDCSRPAPDAVPEALIPRLGAYLGFRAKSLPPVNQGASANSLRAMACFNTGEALGPDAAAKLEAFFERAGAMEAGERRVGTDNRLHRWEWLAGADGTLLKTDALDHASDHDLIGCQDIAWDVAGAIVEWDLAADTGEWLRQTVSDGAEKNVERERVAWFLPCYLAYQLGLWTMALNAAAPAEAARTERERQRYAERLTTWLAG